MRADVRQFPNLHPPKMEPAIFFEGTVLALLGGSVRCIGHVLVSSHRRKYGHV